jgi:hypothetical protein
MIHRFVTVRTESIITIHDQVHREMAVRGEPAANAAETERFVSIAVPTLNEELHVEACLTSLAGQWPEGAHHNQNSGWRRHRLLGLSPVDWR